MKTNKKTTKMEPQMNTIETKIQMLEKAINQLNKLLMNIEVAIESNKLEKQRLMQDANYMYSTEYQQEFCSLKEIK